MNSKRNLIRLFLLILLIFILNFLAMKFYWYSSIWYFDMPMHFLGGVWLALASIYFFPLGNSKKFIWKLLSLVLIVGIGWEIFEILINETITKDSFNLLDTVSDLSFDLAGGCFVLVYYFKKIMPVVGNKV